jgi:hypothetical protein
MEKTKRLFILNFHNSNMTNGLCVTTTLRNTIVSKNSDNNMLLHVKRSRIQRKTPPNKIILLRRRVAAMNFFELHKGAFWGEREQLFDWTSVVGRYIGCRINDCCSIICHPLESKMKMIKVSAKRE